MRLHSPDRGERGERGAIAIITALLAVALLAVAALGVDIATQVNKRQELHDTIDAAAHAGAYDFPNSPLNAEADARANALKNDPTLSLPTTPVNAVAFFCVVASKSNGTAVETTQIPATCNPASAGGSYTGFKCNAAICSIPCNPTAGDRCNTVRVSATKTVPFSFAPVISINSGSTGSVSSAACKGSCGTIAPNPMDVAIVADRTGSMSTTDRNAMVAGIKSMFQVMTPSQQFVSLGTIGRNSGSGSCKTSPSGNETSGPWMAVPFANNYLNSAGTAVNTSSQLIQALNCLGSSSTGTSLAAPMKYAARYLLGYDPNNLSSFTPPRIGTPQKVLIFETDGQPNESPATAGSTVLNSGGDVFSNTARTKSVGSGTSTRYYYNGGHEACENMKAVAANARAAGILVVTIAYNLGGENCDTSDKTAVSGADCKTLAKACAYSKYATPTKVTDALASSASPNAAGAASIADNTCTTSGEQALENADGDYFFCAASGSDMASIFKTALGQLGGGTRLIKLPS